MATTRTATAHWEGSLLEGAGRVNLGEMLGKGPLNTVLKGDVTPDVAPKVESSLGWFYFLSRLFPFNRPMLQPYALDIGLLWNAEDKTRRNINEAVHWSVEKRVAGSLLSATTTVSIPSD